MERVLVLGPCGAGKSALSRRLAATLQLPLVHLDAEYWLPGWVEPEDDAWDRRIEELISRNAWVMDGTYGRTLERRLARADTVLLLDLPTWKCFLGVLKRSALSYGRSRPDMAEGCREHVDLKFLTFVLRYRRVQWPGVLEKLDRFDGAVIKFQTRRSADRFVSSLRLGA